MPYNQETLEKMGHGLTRRPGSLHFYGAGKYFYRPGTGNLRLPVHNTAFPILATATYRFLLCRAVSVGGRLDLEGPPVLFSGNIGTPCLGKFRAWEGTTPHVSCGPR